MNKCIVIIPALNPDQMLLPYVKELSKFAFSQIIVVNDGSDPSHLPIFAELEKYGCVILTHQQNLGKGQALKTAFRYVLENTGEDVHGVITVDADGQHAIKDVCNIAEMLMKNPDHLVLGSRHFDEENVPVRSMLGNKLTSFAFYLLFGRNLADTQTGLRGISKKHLAWMIQLKGDRYEYEMNMLINAIKRNIVVQEHKIETIYFDRNASSYYKTVVDSLKILRRIISGFFRKSENVKRKQEFVSREEK